MEQNHFIQCIEETYHSLTKAEKKVADFVLRNARQVLFMSITDLAEACPGGGKRCIPLLPEPEYAGVSGI